MNCDRCLGPLASDDGGQRVHILVDTCLRELARRVGPADCPHGYSWTRLRERDYRARATWVLGCLTCSTAAIEPQKEGING